MFAVFVDVLGIARNSTGSLGRVTNATPDSTATARVADVSGVPDVLLRSALELAVGIAAEGQKVRPPIVFPAGFKPYLKANRLDAAGLRAVRRALAADDGFRDRLALVDMIGLVDEIGAIWLRRPTGWEAALHHLVDDLQQQAADESAAAALRKSEKRREAAEHVAARTQAELIGHLDALSREAVRRERAEESARVAIARADGLRDDNVGLQREAERLRSELSAAAERCTEAEAALAAITGRLRDVESVRDDLLSQRGGAQAERAQAERAQSERAQAERAQADAIVATQAQRTVSAATALRQAALATRELAAALAAAGEALADPTDPRPEPTASGNGRHETSAHREAMGDVRPLHGRPKRRQPIPIPGGLYGDSAAAAEHLLRVPGVCVLVDGYNVAKLAWPQLALIEQRECCIQMLEDLCRRIGTDIRVVFDGAEVIGASSPRRRLVRVQFSPLGITADDVLRAEIAAMPTHVPAVVVTNDQAIVNDVRAAGVNVISTDTMLCVAGRAKPR